MGIMYESTRNSKERVTASQAVLKGLAPDGGLYVPERIPVLDKTLEEFSDMDYRQTAYEVMKLFLTDYTETELKNCINAAYDNKFDTEEICELRKADDAYFLELFHGRTLAFKDMALSILPHLLTAAAKKNDMKEKIVILTATSGDTGKAALAGFADVPGTKIIVFYPKSGVSKVQEKQMVTQKGKNTSVIGIHGNFDDAQSGVKMMFSDKELEKELKSEGYVFSSANSINIGRLVPQIVYYVYSYAKLVKKGVIKAGDKINVVVPTGNFGNILAAYYAKCASLPIDKLICASNDNKVLYDFFNTGVYDKNREFILTTSPSMDILISSNLERLIYELTGRNSEKTAALMENLKTAGRYELSPEMKDKLKDFAGGFASTEEVSLQIKKVYESDSYIIDTHTAVASAVCDSYRKKSGDSRPVIIASTASPYKFMGSVLTSIDKKYEGMDDFTLADELSKLSETSVPQAIIDLKTAPVLHKNVCDKDEMKKMVLNVLGIN